MQPILLLKTRSSPTDPYAEYFSANGYSPSFIPVLEHRFHEQNLQSVKELVLAGWKGPDGRYQYGGLIFTSQRAVEAFAWVLESIVGSTDQPTKQQEQEQERQQEQHEPPLLFPLYTVGPATARSLSALVSKYSCHSHSHSLLPPKTTVLGAEAAGTGEALAKFILGDYYSSHGYNNKHDAHESGSGVGSGSGVKPPLLFLVGEQRRDIIPRTLMDESLSERERIDVKELVVYETAVRGDFEGAFKGAVEGCEREGLGSYSGGDEGAKAAWVVVFSPTGCDAMLRVLGVRSLEEEDGASGGNGGGVGSRRKGFFVATIGPTTRDHLRNKYGFEAEVCADKPSQDGVGEGIRRFMEDRLRT